MKGLWSVVSRDCSQGPWPSEQTLRASFGGCPPVWCAPPPPCSKSQWAFFFRLCWDSPTRTTAMCLLLRSLPNMWFNSMVLKVKGNTYGEHCFYNLMWADPQVGGTKNALSRAAGSAVDTSDAQWYCHLCFADFVFRALVCKELQLPLPD